MPDDIKYTENDNINIILREKYSKMSLEEIEVLIAELEKEEIIKDAKIK